MKRAPGSGVRVHERYVPRRSIFDFIRKFWVFNFNFFFFNAIIITDRLI